VESKLGPLGTSATYWPIVPAPSDCEDREFGGMNGRGNRSTRRKPAPAPLCPPQILLVQTRDWTRAAAVGSQRLTASAMARPWWDVTININILLDCCRHLQSLQAEIFENWIRLLHQLWGRKLELLSRNFIFLMPDDGNWSFSEIL
jgi:hypothetical protein